MKIVSTTGKNLLEVILFLFIKMSHIYKFIKHRVDIM